MPTPTYTPLATVTLGSSASSVTFSSIPATYRDLIFIIKGTSSVSTSVLFTHNGDATNANYSVVSMVGNNTTRSSSSNGASRFISTFYTTQNVGIVQFLDYSATDKHKTSIARNDNANNETYAVANRWANTAAINSVAISTTAGTFNSGATFSLYAIAS
jgi:hypothetical protein